MNCYYHPEKSAVALCQSCARGLCMECAAAIENGSACKGRCEERASKINKMIDNNSKIIASANAQVVTEKIILFFLGLAMVVVGILFFLAKIPVIGFGFLIVGGWLVVRGVVSRLYPNPDK